MMFNSEVELGKFVGSSDLIRDAYRAIMETSSTFQVHTTRFGMKVLAFSCFPDYTFRFRKGEFDLVSYEGHGTFDFISTKVNPKFSINKAGVELFEQHFAELSEHLNQLIDGPLVITGQGLGGYLAILFAIRFQHEVDEKEAAGSKSAKRPICITFGSPLLGNEGLQGAISERPQWKSSFLNVVAKTDVLASFFSSNSSYKPFGTFLFCMESGGHSTFEDQEAILAVLNNMSRTASIMVSSNDGNSQMHDYSKELCSIKKKVLYRGPSEFNESHSSPLRAEIVFQFQEIGVLDNISNDFVNKITKKQEKMIIKSKNRYEPTKKLNDMKINLTYMEWYMTTRRSKGGYYDAYKNANPTDRSEKDVIIKPQRFLDQYWKETVKKSDLMPQKQGAKLRKRWLYNGTNFRRIIEPLDIADYYKSGRKNYIENRPPHYVMLEKWSEDEKKERKPSEGRKEPASLTEDSCFWAHVEEALISLRDLNYGDLKKFEAYLLSAINDFSLSPDVFVEESSLRKWWSDYYTYKGSSYDSELARYMKNESYKSYKSAC